MRKIIFSLFILGVICALSSGCNTMRGMVEGAKEDWQAAKKWDENFRANWW